MNKWSFNLTKFKSNFIEVLKILSSDKYESSDQYESSEQQLEIDGDQVEITLEINWKMQDDCFIFTTNIKKHTAARRGILIVVRSVLDPLRFLTPLTLKAKLLIQEI